MKSWHTNRARLICYTFAFLGLAVLVFTWGLQYKVSLYAAPPSAVHHMVKAKLLTNEKQSVVADENQLNGAAQSAPVQAHFNLAGFWIGVLLLIGSWAVSMQACELLALEHSRPFSSGVDLNALFYRPPPPSCFS